MLHSALLCSGLIPADTSSPAKRTRWHQNYWSCCRSAGNPDILFSIWRESQRQAHTGEGNSSVVGRGINRCCDQDSARGSVTAYQVSFKSAPRAAASTALHNTVSAERLFLVACISIALYVAVSYQPLWLACTACLAEHTISPRRPSWLSLTTTLWFGCTVSSRPRARSCLCTTSAPTALCYPHFGLRQTSARIFFGI